MNYNMETQRLRCITQRLLSILRFVKSKLSKPLSSVLVVAFLVVFCLFTCVSLSCSASSSRGAAVICKGFEGTDKQWSAADRDVRSENVSMCCSGGHGQTFFVV